MSAAAENTVIFGLSNVHYAIISDEDGSYGTPKKLPGAVSLSISREGSVDTFWADNSGYASFDASNAGYSGTLTIAHMPKEALVDILGYKETNGVTWEDANAPTKRFALLFEVSSNTKPERFAYYEGTLSRPESDANTRTDSTTPDTQALSITMAAHHFDDSTVTAKGFSVKGDTGYENWFTAVQKPVLG